MPSPPSSVGLRALGPWLLAGHFTFAATAAVAQSPFADWQAGAVLDAGASSRELALGQREQGLRLGHSDVSLGGPLSPYLQAQVTFALHNDDGLERELEELWVQSRSLPAGLQLRAGRFASQLGYLNEQHPHGDDFVQRPLLHRAFLGGHWNDDGLRTNWVAPTDFYLRLGLEVFRGRHLVEDAVADRSPGAAVLSGRLGGDLGRSHSWQGGLSLLHNRRDAIADAHAEGEEEERLGTESDAHTHGHGAAFSGRRMWVTDLAWKWAPDGNNARQQLRITFEHARVSGINRFASDSDHHHSSYLSAVWRFAPAWEVGARHDRLRVRAPHEDHFDDGRLRENALMLAWKPTHAHTLRLQFTKQRGGPGFADASRTVQVQYIINFGAHPAHGF